MVFTSAPSYIAMYHCSWVGTCINVHLSVRGKAPPVQGSMEVTKHSKAGSTTQSPKPCQSFARNHDRAWRTHPFWVYSSGVRTNKKMNRGYGRPQSPAEPGTKSVSPPDWVMAELLMLVVCQGSGFPALFKDHRTMTIAQLPSDKE